MAARGNQRHMHANSCSPGRRECDGLLVDEGPHFVVALQSLRVRQARVGIQHRLTKEDAMKWFQQKFDGVVLNKSSY